MFCCFSLLLTSTSSSSGTPTCDAVALATVVKTTGDVSWSLAAMQAYQTLGCQTPGATGFPGSSSFYGQSPSPYSSIPAGSYVDGQSRPNEFFLVFSPHISTMLHMWKRRNFALHHFLRKCCAYFTARQSIMGLTLWNQKNSAKWSL